MPPQGEKRSQAGQEKRKGVNRHLNEKGEDKNMKILTKSILVLGALLSLAIFLPAFAEAAGEKEILIYPDQLVRAEINRDFWLDPVALCADTQEMQHFFVTLDIPNGKEITAVEYYHYGLGDYRYSRVILYRAMIGGFDQGIAYGESSEPEGFSTEELRFSLDADQVVDSNYRYWLGVSLQSACIGGAKVTYK